ncbi:hypothetical protein DS901_14270 [Loktanella sp. D2R18]|uniref:glyoxalase superfamily protein n=1 Tax=Rhodobacterales TaxID=204455 RepID=UPI000DE85912|nr:MULTISPECIES: glyoxalase superfamily protein [Rhodobacterales]MDO6588864.1 glyoxalase superfamily protein [Yoonia sp. 1_MG-2023]RBW41909.1 hypothetical protein DS901_14270 [Loktanella sp. D2R18]
MSGQFPTLHKAKTMAKVLRAGASGMSHAQALEQIAKDHGFRDWNSFHAVICDFTPAYLTVGARVAGRYLGHACAGEIIHLSPQQPGWTRVEIQLDHPVDTVCFTSFKNMRSRITGTIGPDGYSKERTSDGQPHLILDTENMLT